MQKILLNFAVFALALSTLFLTSCGEDEDPGTGGTNDLPPLARFETEAGFLNGDADVIIGESFSVKVSLQTGDAQLKSIEVTEDGTSLPTDRITIVDSDGNDVFEQNALLITGNLKDGVTYSYTISPDGNEVEGTVREYTFTVTDDNNLSDQVSLNVSSVLPPGTPIDMTLTGVLLNQAGPAGTGGLDLDNGEGTGSTDSEAEIRDLGIDCTINPDNAENWRAEFGTTDGVVMVKVDKSQVENLTFDNVDTKEAIIGAYDTGFELEDGVSTDPNCDETVVTDVSGTLAVDDLFVVLSNGTYYMLRVDEVNPLGSANDDNIVFSIKY